ncbi:MAG: insulinase family protein [Rhodospirillales bacterium]|nr:insulinase family protein [Rhodospirillales bacterium]
MSAVRVTTLANGLRVASNRMPTVETVSLGVWIEAGGRDEDAANCGVSHLLEHMVFKGTERRDARAIAEEIESVGGHLNAHTSREYTAYYAKVLKEDIALAVDIVADIVQNAVIDPEELDRERTVVVQEIMQTLDTPDDIVFDRFQETAFPDQPIGRSILGPPDLIRGLPRDALVGYMQDHYRAARMVLAASGNLEHDTLVALAERAFADLPTGDMPKREPARYTGGDWRDDRDLEQVHIILGLEGMAYHDLDFYAQSVLSTFLGGGMSSRLFQEIREKRGLVYSIYTFPTSFADAGIFGIYAGTGATEVAELIPLVCEEMHKVSSQVGEEEVARARTQLKASILMSLESTSARCEQLARQLIVFGRPLTVSEIVSKIESIDVDAVQRVASKLLASTPTVTAIGPISHMEDYNSVAARLAL